MEYRTRRPKQPTGPELLHQALSDTTLDHATRDRAQGIAKMVDEITQRRLAGIDTKRPELARQRINATRDFFLNQHPSFPHTPSGMIAERFGLLEEKQPRAEQAMLKVIIELLFVQEEKDLIRYVPHDAHHALYVDRIADQLLEQHPEVRDAVMERYGISPAEARFCMSLVNILHDCGYPYLVQEDGRMLSKSTHCLFSADLFGKKEMRGPFMQLFGHRQKRDVLFGDMQTAIEWHNSDVAAEPFTVRLITDHGVFLTYPQHLQDVMRGFNTEQGSPAHVTRTIQKIEVVNVEVEEQVRQQPLTGKTTQSIKKLLQIVEGGVGYFGRHADLRRPHDRLIGLEHRKKELRDHPLLGQLVIADNLHSGLARRRPIEETQEFWAVVDAIGNPQKFSGLELLRIRKLAEQVSKGQGSLDGLIERARSNQAISTENITDPHIVVERFQRALIDTVLAQFGRTLSKEQLGLLRQYAYEQIPENFYHVGGHLAVKEITIEGMDVIIHLSDRAQALPAVMQQEKFKGNTFAIPMNLYIAWRIEKALDSISLNGKKFRVLIQELNGERFEPQYMNML